MEWKIRLHGFSCVKMLMLLLGSYAHIVTPKYNIHTHTHTCHMGRSYIFRPLLFFIAHRFKPFDQFHFHFRTLQYIYVYLTIQNRMPSLFFFFFFVDRSYKMTCVKLNNTKQRMIELISWITQMKSFEIRLTATTNQQVK